MSACEKPLAISSCTIILRCSEVVEHGAIAAPLSHAAELDWDRAIAATWIYRHAVSKLIVTSSAGA